MHSIGEHIDSWAAFAARMPPGSGPALAECGSCLPRAAWAVTYRALRVANKQTEEFCEAKGWDNMVGRRLFPPPLSPFPFLTGSAGVFFRQARTAGLSPLSQHRRALRGGETSQHPEVNSPWLATARI